MTKKKAATLVETIMILVVLAIISATVSGVIIFFTQLFLYSPRQLDSQKIGQELCSLILEGTPEIRGIRFSRALLDASSTQISYTYGYPTTDEQLSVRFRWDSADKHIYRSTSTNGGVSWSAESVIPYYVPATVTIDGKDTSGAIFTYKKTGDTDWVSGIDTLSSILRVIIAITVKTGTGAFGEFQGFANFTSSAERKGL